MLDGEPTLLTNDAFDATFSAPMRDVTREATNVIDIWPYVASIPPADLCGHQVCDDSVESVYQDATGRYDHVLVKTKTQNVYLVVVVDLSRDQIFGHHLLDLNEKYGVTATRGE